MTDAENQKREALKHRLLHELDMANRRAIAAMNLTEVQLKQILAEDTIGELHQESARRNLMAVLGKPSVTDEVVAH